MDMIEMLQAEQHRLQAIINRASIRMSSAPEGSLDINISGSTPRYRLRTAGPNKKSNRRYLKADEMNTVRLLAQKGYDAQLLKEAKKQYAAVTAFLNNYDEKALIKIYEDLSPERKLLINGEILDDEAFTHKRESGTYPPGTFEANAPEFYTLRNERVRSKTEKIIADTLFARENPYRYEPPLQILNGQKPWRPDFLVLNKRTRKEYIWEHLGRMDDEDYCRRNIRKLEKYNQQGIFIGEKLIVTMETSEHPLPTRIIDAMIDKYLT